MDAQYQQQFEILKAIDNQNIDKIKQLVSEGADPNLHDMMALTHAVKQNDAGCTEFLLSHAPEDFDPFDHLMSACMLGKDQALKGMLDAIPPKKLFDIILVKLTQLVAHYDKPHCLEVLVGNPLWTEKVGTAKNIDSFAFIASHQGSPDSLRILHTISPDTFADPKYLIRAAENGKEKCVELLISFLNPRDITYDSSRALRVAAEKGHIECVKILVPHSGEAAIERSAVSAIFGRHFECTKMLLGMCSPENVKQELVFRGDEGGLAFLGIRIIWLIVEFHAAPPHKFRSPESCPIELPPLAFATGGKARLAPKAIPPASNAW